MVEVSVADGMKTPLNRFRLDGQVANTKVALLAAGAQVEAYIVDVKMK